MEFRERLRKAAGLFVEMPPEEDVPRASIPAPEPIGGAAPEPAPEPAPAPRRTVEQLVRDTEGPNLDEIQVPQNGVSLAPGADGKPNFHAVYDRAGLPAASFTAEQMLDLLASLPADMPLEMRRETMKVTLGALGQSIGATSDTIVADASRKLAALTAYTESLSKRTTDIVSAAERDIAALQAQIEDRRKDIGAAKQANDDAVQLCSAESKRLDDVLEFFSLDIPPSRLSPGAK